LTARETPTTLALGYRLQGNKLDLEAIELKAPETEIKGALAVLLDQTLIDGSLEGRIADLGALAPLIQQQLGGSVDLTASLTPEGESQSAALTIEGNDLQGDFGRLRTVNAKATITDAIKAPKANAKATITGFEQGANKVDALTLTASGGEDAVELDFSMAGEVIKTLELTGKAAARFEDGLTLGIERLDGAFAGEPLRLQTPLTFRQAGEDITISDLDLRLGAASLTGNVAIGAREVLGEIDLRSLPLSWSEVFGGPLMTGDVNAAIDLSGSPADPSVVTTLNVDGTLVDGVAAGDLPLTIALNTSIDQGRLTADLQGSGLTKKPITASASLPAKLALHPFAFDMPEDGALEGKIDAEVLLARLGDLLALDDQTLRGTLTADIALSGTLATPNIEGPVKIEGGAYENGATGTDLRDINLNAIASSQRIEVVGLAARTGKKRGNLSANGWLDLDAEANFPLSVTLELDNARLVNRDDADARISGEIAMTGNLADAVVEGDLFVNRAEISIPDGGGPNLPELEVTEVGGRFVNPVEEEEEASAEQPFDPALDMRIELPNKIFVRGRGLESEWQGDLEITGRASEPIIVGDLSIKKGFFDFLDKRFDLARGEIVFSGSTPPNPIVALEARAEDDDFTAIIKLNGPADDPELVLSSEPVLPDDEVLARLLFNRQLSEIGPVEAGKLALAANKLRGGGGGFDAFGEIRNILRIDTLDVVSDEEGETAVKAGKYLDDDVYVEVEKGAGDESGRARVEIEVLPNIAIEAETSENADTGVGVKWKLDY
ncbi:MAG: translocation/assembly module TamB domain-containing protein, partial [Geminicoccaceae bacterium]